MTTVFVLVSHGQGLSESLGGKLPRTHPPRFGSYGYGHAQAHMDIVYSSDHAEGRWQGVVRQALKQALGFDLVHAWRNRDAFNRADIVWTHTEKEHLAISVLK